MSNDNLEIIKEHNPTMTVGAMKLAARSVLYIEDQLSELVDNAILSDKNSCVNISIIMRHDKDDDKSYIEVRDDSIGIPEDRILEVFDLGSRVNSEYFLLGQMGMGLKGAIWGLGELDFVFSKTKSGNMSEVRAKPYSNLNETLVYCKVTPTDNLLNGVKSGTVVRIKRVNKRLPPFKTEQEFNQFVEKFNSMYAFLLKEGRVNINIYYNNVQNPKLNKQASCEGSFPLMSNPRHILDEDLLVGPLGHNEPIFRQETDKKIEKVSIKTKNTSVKLTAWHKPTPDQVKLYFEKTKDPTYDPEKYQRSPFGYGNEKAGIAVKYKEKVIMFNLEKESSRETNKGILIEIDDNSGLTFTQYKNSIVPDPNYTECMEAIRTYLQEQGFLIRTSDNAAQPIHEKEIVKKFIDYIKNDKVYKRDFGIIDFDEQVKTLVRTEVGEADVVIYDYQNKNKVNIVIEAKRDKCGAEEARQLWGYMCEFDCTRGILLTGVKEKPTFAAQVKAFKRHHTGFNMEVADVDSLNSSKFFK